MLQAKSIVAGSERPAPVRAAVPLTPPVGHRQTVGSRKKLVLAVCIFICFALSLLTIAQYSSIVSLNYEISQAEAALNSLQEEYRAMELEVARLSSLGRVETIAREDLGMQEPDQSQLKVLTAGQSDGPAFRE